MDDELLGFRLPSSLAFDASDITSMAKLRPLVISNSITLQYGFDDSLSIASNHFPVIDSRQPIVALFIVALFLDRSDEHLDVDHVRAHIVAQVHSHFVVFFAPVLLVHQTSEFFPSSKTQVIAFWTRQVLLPCFAEQRVLFQEREDACLYL